MLGCDIAKDHTLMGNCTERGFAEVWHSVEAEQVRRSPYPACYNIKSPSGARLADDLKEAFIPITELVRSRSASK